MLLLMSLLVSMGINLISDPVLLVNIAVPFFKELGAFAEENKTCFCIEPNPEIYGADFIRTTIEAIELVKLVDHPLFRLNIDLGTIIANSEPLEETFRLALPYAGHIHISEPYLEKISHDTEKHQTIKRILDQYHYDKAISIEMKSGEIGKSNISNIRETLSFINGIYNE